MANGSRNTARVVDAAYRLIAIALISSVSANCALRSKPKANALDEVAWSDLVRKAEVWHPTNVRGLDLRTGPPGPGAFKPNATVHCTYVPRDLGGNTPKFACVLPNGDEVRVKYGRANGEVFAEVAATRLLWALGFGADRAYPVRVVCRGCPGPDDGNGDNGRHRKPGENGANPERAEARPVANVTTFEFATIERRMSGREVEGPKGAGWSWDELDEVDPRAGRSAVAHRDALKLLAVVLQHTDSKREQQRLVCLGSSGRRGAADCRRPFMLVGDLGKTFGKANIFNRDTPGSVNLEAWAQAAVWADAPGCKGNLPKSFTGTLDNPTISEAGRAFLAGLLAQLSDRQLYDLFEVARFPAREADGEASNAEVLAWVTAFKDKVAQIASRTCEPARQAP